MAKDKKNNKVRLCFEALAEWQNIPLVFGWKAELVKKIGHQLYIKNSNKIGTWENRNYIPDDTITRILKLDIPDSIKTLCKNCVKLPPENSSPNPGSTNRIKGIGRDGKVFDPRGCSFSDEEAALKLKRLLFEIEQISEEVFIHQIERLEIVLDTLKATFKKKKGQI